MEKFIKEIAVKAGKAIAGKFGKIGVKYIKTSPTDVVTEADLTANKIITNAIKQKFPTHGIVSEEEPEFNTGSDYIWYIDPLDGTLNFSTGTPMFGTLIALSYKGKVELAVDYDPILKNLFFAKRGQGAFWNYKPIHCSKQKNIIHSLGCAGSKLAKNRIILMTAFLQAAKKQTFWLSMFGSIATTASFVASGRRDWYCGGDGYVWDYAAPSLILQEAGCKVTNYAGKPWQITDRQIVAANPTLHKKLMKIIKKTGIK